MEIRERELLQFDNGFESPALLLKSKNSFAGYYQSKDKLGTVYIVEPQIQNNRDFNKSSFFKYMPDFDCTATSSNCPTPIDIFFRKSEIDIRKEFIYELKAIEFTKYNNYITDIEEAANKKTGIAIDYIKDIPFEENRFSLELNPKPSIIFTILMEEEVALFIEIYFKNEVPEEQAFFSIFKEENCIANGIGSMQAVFDDVRNYLSTLKNKI